MNVCIKTYSLGTHYIAHARLPNADDLIVLELRTLTTSYVLVITMTGQMPKRV